MRKSIQLHIPEPCHEDWTTMEPVEVGKYCAACQKQVVDFTGMSDLEQVLSSRTFDIITNSWLCKQKSIQFELLFWTGA